LPISSYSFQSSVFAFLSSFSASPVPRRVRGPLRRGQRLGRCGRGLVCDLGRHLRARQVDGFSLPAEFLDAPFETLGLRLGLLQMILQALLVGGATRRHRDVRL
jgi:hypothetical protein